MADFVVKRLSVIGLGLIGGSVALAARAQGITVLGMDAKAENAQLAEARGAVTAITADWSELLAVDVVVLAVPLGAMPRVLAKIAAVWPQLPQKPWLTDVGSVKAPLMATVKRYLPDFYQNFVPGHPLAGGENSGMAAARADLFVGKKWLLTPEADTDPEAVAAVVALLQKLQAQVLYLTAEKHDALLAATSHLPHLLAFALVEALGRWYPPTEVFALTGGGFRDFTRIAGSDPVMWRDICQDNQQAILKALADYQQALAELAALCQNGDWSGVAALFARAQALRRQYGLPPAAEK
jgi:prephenate dehydrogenase